MQDEQDSFASRSQFNIKSSEVSAIHTFTSDQAFTKEISLRKSLWLPFSCEVHVFRIYVSMNSKEIGV